MTTAHLWIVIGGELATIGQDTYREGANIRFYGAYPDKQQANAVWKSASMQNVDNAHYRVRIVSVY